MEICKGTMKEPHEEIVFAQGGCPLCEALEDLAATQVELDNMVEESGE